MRGVVFIRVGNIESKGIFRPSQALETLPRICAKPNTGQGQARARPFNELGYTL